MNLKNKRRARDLARAVYHTSGPQAIETMVSQRILDLADFMGVTWHVTMAGANNWYSVNYAKDVTPGAVALAMQESECEMAANALWPDDADKGCKPDLNPKVECNCGSAHDTFNTHSDWCDSLTAEMDPIEQIENLYPNGFYAPGRY